MENLSCCGAECVSCDCYGTLCKGCNESEGKVFHVTDGRACRIYECAVNVKKYAGCGSCGELPCRIWRETRDPRLTDEQFEKSIRFRMANLKEGIEEKAERILEQCNVISLASVNEKGYPRICTVGKAFARGFQEIYIVTSKRSEKEGKAAHFEKNQKSSVCYFLGSDSVTLIGNVETVQDKELQRKLWKDSDSEYFDNGVDDPNYRLLRFRTIEATFWIDGVFRTEKYD